MQLLYGTWAIAMRRHEIQTLKCKRPKAGSFLLLCFDIFIAHDSALNNFPSGHLSTPPALNDFQLFTFTVNSRRDSVTQRFFCALSWKLNGIPCHQHISASNVKVRPWTGVASGAFGMHIVNVHKVHGHCLIRLTFYQ